MSKKLNILIIILFLIQSTSFIVSAHAEDANVTWDANSEQDLLGYKIYYGTSSNSYSHVIDVGNVLEYTVSNLSAGVTYYFAMTAYDTAYNESDYSSEIAYAVSGNGNEPPLDNTGPIISNLVTINITANSVTINWESDEPSDSQVEYGLNIDYGSHTPLNEDMVTSHSVNISNLESNSTYHFRVKSKDESGNLTVSDDFSFTTSDDGTSFDITIQAEDMQIKTVGQYIRLPGWALWDNGYIANEVDFPFSAEYVFTLRAKGNYINDEWTKAEIRIDQVSQKIIDVNSTNYTEFQVPVTVTEGSHEVAIAFINDYYVEGQDRNLWIDWLRIQGDSSIPPEQPTPPTVTDVMLINPELIRVYFSHPMDETSVTTVENYQISPGIQVFSVNFDPSSMFVTLTTSTHQLDKDYTLSVQNVKSATAVMMDAPYSETYRFVDTSPPPEQDPPTITDVVLINPELIRVYFSQQMNAASATNTGNYQISPSLQILSIDLDASKMFVTLTTNTHQQEVDYTLMVQNVRSSSDVRMEGPFTKTYRFMDTSPEPEQIPPTVTDVVLISPESIRVYFSQAMNGSSVTKKENYQISPSVHIVSIDLDASKMFVTLSTSVHQTEIDYTLTVQNVRSSSDVSIENPYTKTYRFVAANPEPEQIPPTVTDVVLINPESIRVYFSQPMDEFSVTKKENYQISPSVHIVSIDLDASQMFVTLSTSAHQVEKNYTLTVQNVRNSSDLIIENSFSKTYRFPDTSPPPEEVTAPAITDIVFFDPQTIRVYYTQLMNRVTVTKKENYQISPVVHIVSINLDSSLMFVTLKTSTHREEIDYTLRVQNVTNYSNVAIAAPYVKTYRFPDTNPPFVTQINLVDLNTIEVFYSEEMDSASIASLSSYNIAPQVSITSVRVNNVKNKVTLRTNAHSSTVDYILTVQGVSDVRGNSMASTFSINYSFAPNHPPTVVDVQAVDRQTIIVIYSEKMDYNSVDDIGNYSISPYVELLDVVVDQNQQKVTLHTTEHQANTGYTLTVSGVKDISQLEIAQQFSYDYSFSDHTPPYVERMELESKDRIKIYFSEYMAMNSLSGLDNYVISPIINVRNVIVDDSGLLVTLDTDTHQENTSYNLSFRNVTDLAENAIPLNYTIQYRFNGSVDVKAISKAAYSPSQLSVGDEYYIDRSFKLVEIPDGLIGQTWIKTANNDKFSTASEFLTFKVEETVRVYVGYDERIAQLPTWLQSWNDDHLVIKDENNTSFRCYSKDFVAGSVTLGGNFGNDNSNMYVVVLKSLDGNMLELPDPETIDDIIIPENFVLKQNYPNPFNGYTEIGFEAKQAGIAEMVIYDVLGREVKRLKTTVNQAGKFFFVWDGKNTAGIPVSSGVYTYSLKSNEKQVSLKMTLLK